MAHQISMSASEVIREPNAEGRYAGSNDSFERGRSSYGRKWARKMENGLVCAYDVIDNSFNDCSLRQAANMFRIAILLEQQTPHFRTEKTHRIRLWVNDQLDTQLRYIIRLLL